LGHATTRSQPVLADQFEYSYLAGRPATDSYFWNMRGVVSAGALERSLGTTRVVVTTSRDGSSYPVGFVKYLVRHRYTRFSTGGATVWLIPGSASAEAAGGRASPGDDDLRG
jgi:hypothetical protein